MKLAPFAVTNAQFAECAAATRLVTTAEEAGVSFVFAGLLPDDFPLTRGVEDAPWWREVPGASWRHPEGQGSEITERLDHPVVHLSIGDMRVFCEWAEARLPTEAEWSTVAGGAIYPWGDELHPGGEHRCNIWQGEFPVRNSCDDGWYGTCPVDAYEPNAAGCYNLAGNVWELTADSTLKGGSYLCHASYCAGYRNDATPMPQEADATAGNVGFRVMA